MNKNNKNCAVLFFISDLHIRILSLKFEEYKNKK